MVWMMWEDIALFGFKVWGVYYFQENTIRHSLIVYVEHFLGHPVYYLTILLMAPDQGLSQDWEFTSQQNIIKTGWVCKFFARYTWYSISYIFTSFATQIINYKSTVAQLLKKNAFKKKKSSVAKTMRQMISSPGYDNKLRPKGRCRENQWLLRVDLLMCVVELKTP